MEVLRSMNNFVVPFFPCDPLGIEAEIDRLRKEIDNMIFDLLNTEARSRIDSGESNLINEMCNSKLPRKFKESYISLFEEEIPCGPATVRLFGTQCLHLKLKDYQKGV